MSSLDDLADAFLRWAQAFGALANALPTEWPSVLGSSATLLLPTQVEIGTTTVPSSVTYIEVAGYAAINDGGAPIIFTRGTVDPGTAGAIQSADGAWWDPGTTLLVLDGTLARGISNGVGLEIISSNVHPFLVSAIQYQTNVGILFQVAPNGSITVYDQTAPSANQWVLANSGGVFLLNSSIGGTNLTVDQSGNLSSTGTINTNQVFEVLGTQVVGTRAGGWGTPTGAIDRSTFDTGGALTVNDLAQRVAALIDDLKLHHGLLG